MQIVIRPVLCEGKKMQIWCIINKTEQLILSPVRPETGKKENGALHP